MSYLPSERYHVRIQRGGGGCPDPPPPENYQKYRVFSNTGPDSLEITKLPSQHSMTDHHQPASETPFKWRFASGPIMAPALSGIWILPQPYKMHQLKKGKTKSNTFSMLIRTPSDKTFWIRAWICLSSY